MNQILPFIGGQYHLIQMPHARLSRQTLTNAVIHTNGAVVQGSELHTAHLTSADYAHKLDTTEPTTYANQCRFVGGLSNFGHAIFESLTRFAVHEIFDGRIDQCPYAVWKGSPVARFLDLLDVPYVELQPPCRFAHIVVPCCPMGRDAEKQPYVIPDVIWYLRTRFWQFGQDGAARYYFKRNANHRRVLNEDALIATLAKRDFAALDLAGCPLAEQIRLISSASISIMPCGAGSPMSLFARGSFVELAPPTIDGVFGSRLFCAVLGNPYMRVNGNAQGKSIDADYMVPIGEVLKVVDVWEATARNSAQRPGQP